MRTMMSAAIGPKPTFVYRAAKVRSQPLPDIRAPSSVRPSTAAKGGKAAIRCASHR